MTAGDGLFLQGGGTRVARERGRAGKEGKRMPESLLTTEELTRYKKYVSLAQNNDCYYKPALILFAIVRKDFSKWIKPGEINFSSILKQCKAWSSSEIALTKLAATLYNSRWKVSIDDVFYSLDGRNVEIALMAIAMRYR